MNGKCRSIIAIIAIENDRARVCTGEVGKGGRRASHNADPSQHMRASKSENGSVRHLQPRGDGTFHRFRHRFRPDR